MGDDHSLCKRVVYSENDIFIFNNQKIKIKENFIWVEGDNKNNSLDSRYFG